jgi:hypothetical protein
MMYCRTKGLDFKTRQPCEVYPWEKSKERLAIVNTSSRKHVKTAMLVSSICLGTLFTLIISHSLSSKSPTTANVGQVTSLAAQSLRWQYLGMPEITTLTKLTASDESAQIKTKSGSPWLWGFGWGSMQQEQPENTVAAAAAAAAAAPKPQEPHTLVLYVFSNTDKEYINNLLFFINNGIREGDGCQYIIIVNTFGDSLVRNPSFANCLRVLSALFWHSNDHSS